MNKYKKNEIITTGTDNVQLDSPTFEIVNISIDTVANILHVEIMHEVNQGSLIQKHSRTFDVEFKNLPSAVKITGASFLSSIELEMLKLPQYSGANEI